MTDITLDDRIIHSTVYDSGGLTYERPTGRDTMADRIMTIIARLANANDWTLKRLAEKSGLPADTVTRLLDANATVNVEDTERMANAFDLTFFDLMNAAEHATLATPAIPGTHDAGYEYGRSHVNPEQ